MKIKKTIAAIAAAAMVFTALPMAAFADAPSVTVDNVTNTTPTTAISTSEDEKTITVTVMMDPSAEGTIVTGQPEDGDENARENYHVSIPVTGLTGDWSFASDSEYKYDDEAHKDWNITSGTLMLWMPVDSNECTVKLVNGDNTKTVVVKTVTHKKHTFVKKTNASTHWEECACGLIRNVALHDFSDGNCTCGTAAPAPASSANIRSESSGSSSSSSSGSASTTVSTPAEVRSANKADVKIDAAATKVTPAMVKAFTSNTKTKTMTISYNTKLQVAINKSDIKDASAALDFSVSGNNVLSDKAIKSNKTLAKAKAITQLDFVKSGKIDGVDKVTIKGRVGGKYVGQKATVYEYVDGKLVKVAVTKVGGSGLVSFKVDHLGKFVIVVD